MKNEESRLEWLRSVPKGVPVDHAATRAAEAPVLLALAEAGFPVDELSDFAERFAPLPEQAVQVLLDHLPQTTNEIAREWIARTLAATRCVFPGKVLADAFDASRNDFTRWAIANTMACTNAAGIDRWLIARAGDESQGSPRQMLLLALARHAPQEQALPILREALRGLTGHAAMALAKIGEPDDIPPLEDAEKSAPTWAKREISKAIKAIQRRQLKRRSSP